MNINNVKKILLAILAVQFIGYAFAAETDFYVMEMSPLQVAPGETSTLQVTLKNLGTTTASRIEVRLDPYDTSPIDPIGPGRLQIDIAEGARTTTHFGVVKQLEEITLAFNISVGPNVAEKTYLIPLVLMWDASEGTVKTQTLQLGVMIKERNAEFQIVDISPERLTEGETTKVIITLLNSGDNEGKDLKVSLDPNDISPINPIGPIQLEFNDETILQGETIEIQYPIKVKENITENVYYTPIFLEWKDSVLKTTSQISQAGFYIKKSQSSVEVSHNTPDTITPGSEFDISLSLKNTGSIVKNVEITIDEDSNSLLAISSNNMHIKQLVSGETANFDMKFISGKDMATGLYSIPLTLRYIGLDGQTKIQKERIPVEVKGHSKLNIASLKIDPQNPKKGDTVTIELRVENVGDADADDAKLILDSTLHGFKTAYLGELEKSDDTPAIFTLHAPAAGKAVNQMTLTYEDDFGKHTVTEEIRFDISNNQTQSIGNILIPLLVAMVLIVYVVAKKRNR